MTKPMMSLMTFFSLTLLNNITPVMCFAPMVKETYLTRIANSSPPPFPPATPPVAVQSKSFLPFYELYHHESINHFSEKANYLNEEFGKNIVLSVSSNLPKFDSVGHNILSANHDFIASILSNSHLSGPMKKSIILASIKLAQMGDDMGSSILQQYYNLVERCL